MFRKGVERNLHHRSKRYLYAENKTCGYIPFCSEDIHDPELFIPTALADDPRCSKATIYFSITLDVILIVLIFFSNIMIITVAIRSNSANKHQRLFKANLALFDLMVGIVIIPGTISNKVRFLLLPLEQSYIMELFKSDNDVVNVIFGMALTLSLTGSLSSLFLLSLDRFLAITRPFRYSEGKLMSVRKATVLICMVWIFGIFLSIVPLGDTENFHYTVDYFTLAFILEFRFNDGVGNIYHGLFFLLLVFIIPYICTVTITLVTWALLLRDRRRINSAKLRRRQENYDKDLKKDDPDETTDQIKEQKKKKVSMSKRRRIQFDKDLVQVTRTITLIIVTFSICVLPFMTAQAMNLTNTDEMNENIEKYGAYNTPNPRTCNPTVYLVVLYFMFLNSFMNFIIYSLRNENFRQEVMILLRIKSRDAAKPSPGSGSRLSSRNSVETFTSNLGSRRTSDQNFRRASHTAVVLETVREAVELEDIFEIYESDEEGKETEGEEERE